MKNLMYISILFALTYVTPSFAQVPEIQKQQAFLAKLQMEMNQLLHIVDDRGISKVTSGVDLDYEEASKRVAKFVWDGRLTKAEKVSETEKTIRYNLGLVAIAQQEVQNPGAFSVVIRELKSKYWWMNANRVGAMTLAASAGGAAVYTGIVFFTSISAASIIVPTCTGVAGLISGWGMKKFIDRKSLGRARFNPDVINKRWSRFPTLRAADSLSIIYNR